MSSSWFDSQRYLQSKLAQTQRAHETDANGKPYTLDSLQAALADAGLTPEQHYALYGRTEGLNPNPYFNENEYLAAKLQQLQHNPDTTVAAEWKGKSTADLAKVMADSGMTPVEHYEKYGAFETQADGSLLNPSNAFDANAYVAAKLAEMVAKGETLNGKAPGELSAVDVLAAMQASGMSAVSHFLQYGAAEANAYKVPLVQTVPQDQRVPNDPQRPASEYVSPNYNQSSKGPAESTPQPVTKPADVGGYTDTGISPPVVPPSKPAPVPGDKGYVAPPPGVVDDGTTVIFPPSTTVSPDKAGTGPNTGWTVVDSSTGKGTVIDNSGKVMGKVELPVQGDTVQPPKPDTPIRDGNGSNINNHPVDDTGHTVTPDPGPPAPQPLAMTKPVAPGTTIVVTGSTDVSGAKAELILDAADELSINGQPGSLTVGHGYTIDAMAVTGTSSLYINVGGSDLVDLTLKGAASVATDMSIKTVIDAYGGSSGDTLHIGTGGFGVTGTLSLGGGNDAVYLEGTATQNLGRIVLSSGEYLQLRLGVEGETVTGRPENYSGTLKADQSAHLAFEDSEAGGTGAANAKIQMSLGNSLHLFGGTFNGIVLGTTSKDVLTLTGTATVVGGISLDEGNDTLDLSARTSSVTQDVLLGKGEGTAFQASGVFSDGVETIKASSSAPKAFAVLVDNYTGKNAAGDAVTASQWHGDISQETLADIAADITNTTGDNKAYLARGTYDATTGFSSNVNGNDWLLVYDADASAVTAEMETVLLVGLGDGGNLLTIINAGAIGFA